jgi:predicted Zn-dependent protease
MTMAGTLAMAGGCSVNPVTGRRQFNSLSREQEIQIGEEAMPQLVEGYGGAVEDAGVRRYMDSVGFALVEHTELDYPDLPWEFTLLDSDVINAFALPGGKVFVSRALIEEMDNEAQLAGVLGHEIGHVTGQHADDAVSRKMVLAGIAIGAAVAAGVSDEDWAPYAAGAVVGGSGLFALSFDRDQELEADKLGLRYMTKAGYAPRGLLQVMKILKEAGGSGGNIELLSTHPHPDTRIKKIKKALKNQYLAQDTSPDFAFFENRFESRMLSPLSRVSRADEPRAVDLTAHDHGLAFWAPEGWCAHCAAKDQLLMQIRGR